MKLYILQRKCHIDWTWYLKSDLIYPPPTPTTKPTIPLLSMNIKEPNSLANSITLKRHLGKAIKRNSGFQRP